MPHSKIKDHTVSKSFYVQVAANIGKSFEKNHNLYLSERNQSTLHQPRSEVIMSVYYDISSKITVFVYFYKWGFWIIVIFVIKILLLDYNFKLSYGGPWTVLWPFCTYWPLQLLSLSCIHLCVTEHAVTSQKVWLKDMFTAACWGVYRQQLAACMLI